MQVNNKGVIVIEGHVQGLANTRMLAKYGIPVIVLDVNECIAAKSKYCYKFFKCPDYKDESFIDFLEEIHDIENLHDWMLLPSNDHIVHNIAKHHERLTKKFMLITANLDIIEQIYSKRSLLEIASRAELPIPRTFFPTKEDKQLPTMAYPLIIKGINGLSFYKKYHKKAFVINDYASYEDTMSSILNSSAPEEYFIQEIIPYDNKTISVAVYASEGKILNYWMGAKLREHPIKFGTATCCESIIDPILLALSSKLIEAIGFSGICEIEWLLDSRDGLYKLIEINARTWLWVGFAEKCGINLPLIAYKHLYYRHLTEQKVYKTDLYWINIFTDIVYSFVRLFKRLDNIQSIMKPYKNFTEATWDIKDIKPFVSYFTSIFKFLRER